MFHLKSAHTESGALVLVAWAALFLELEASAQG